MLEPRRASLLSIALASALLAAACGAEAPHTGVSVGAATNHDARLGVVRSDQQILAYVCGGPSSYATHSRWFRGPAGTELSARSLTIESEGWELALELDGDELRATLRDPNAAGETIAFTENAPAAEGTMAGLYSALDRGCRTGVIVFQASADQAPALQGTWCDDSGNFQQVERTISNPALDRSSARMTGFEVEVQRPDGRAILQVEPAAP